MKKRKCVSLAIAVLAIGIGTTACGTTTPENEYEVISTAPYAAEADMPEPETTNPAPPRFTVFEHQHQHYLPPIPESSMPIAEAAAFAGKYIYNMLDVNIDGMYLIMWHDVREEFTRNFWHGSVALTRQATGIDIDHDEIDWDAILANPLLNPYNPLFNFIIDAETGEGIDLTYWWGAWTGHSADYPPPPDSEELWEAWRESSMQQMWMEMDNDTIKERLGISQEDFNAIYTQTALDDAARHFENTTVMNIVTGISVINPDRSLTTWGGIYVEPVRDTDGNLTAQLSSLNFTVTDHTGRMANLQYIIVDGEMRLRNISTQANDVIR
ncbi:MAG: hypothetical protein FWE05_01075 [Defluviitaleaceae bacterium]|nr:hypothetical protein [Defluviitaleaceae bacterium]